MGDGGVARERGQGRGRVVSSWGPGWYLLANGFGIHLSECRPCSCGEPTKLITRDGASCPRCKEKRLRGERVLARLDCRTGAVTEEPRRKEWTGNRSYDRSS